MLVDLSLPPGLWANGTVQQAAGRWYDAHLVRFSANTVRPWGGWVEHIEEADALVGKARAMITWTDNSAVRWIAVGTAQKLYVIDRIGTVTDITPSGYSAGLDDATIGGGFGGGGYGVGDYGESPGDPEIITPATVWSLDTFGENLVALNNSDGKLYIWELDTANPATAVTASGSTATPEDNQALIVDETGHILLLGAGGDGRLVQWCDAQDETQWDAGLPSEAGSFPLQTGGALRCGRRTRGGTLLLTDQDAWLAIYNAGANPFGFEQVGKGCGVVSQGAAVSTGDGLVAWMGPNGFWAFNGGVVPLDCGVADRVFRNLFRPKISHVTGYHNPDFGEIVWHYPTSSNGDNSAYVVWNYRENHWTSGYLGRTCGVERGTFNYPMAVDADGMVWRHESGFDHGDEDPYIESGPLQFGGEGETGGARVFTALNLIPDELTLGDVVATFYGRMSPTDPIETFGPYSASQPTNVRFTTRHLRMRLVAAGSTDFRVGLYKLDIQLGGER